MKKAYSITLALAMMLSVFLTAVPSFAQDSKPLTTKEVAKLLKTANEPVEHRRISEYYQQEAAKQRRNAREHSGLAAIYEQTHPFAAMEAKHGDAFGQGASHCKKFSELAEAQAKEADALAALHEDMAKAAEQK